MLYERGIYRLSFGWEARILLSLALFPSFFLLFNHITIVAKSYVIIFSCILCERVNAYIFCHTNNYMIGLHGKMISGPNRSKTERDIENGKQKQNGKWNWHKANDDACNRLANRVVLLTIFVCIRMICASSTWNTHAHLFFYFFFLDWFTLF